ncbi:hypothetical protein MUN89_15660 [Halobacillus salinarum]|uniref:Uncharacterized protein n=1 Tax=Halobacillus salinarum TaxID=2932257 RepID=A0ABY4EH11_9BACI|nr:hypothetical protein [Halobacillus salinarum]UOQ43347.1 hypothetical protein MUN89_15660 [Halobacillus salinarum]
MKELKYSFEQVQAIMSGKIGALEQENAVLTATKQALIDYCEELEEKVEGLRTELGNYKSQEEQKENKNREVRKEKHKSKTTSAK